MEVTGAKTMFARSNKRHLRYTELFRDGDSKTFPAVEDIYMKDKDPIRVEKKNG